jgi:hypothetical protein
MAINFCIKPIIRTDKPVKQNNKFPIYWLVRLNNTQLKIPAKKDIEASSWDKLKGSAVKSYSNYNTLNGALGKAEQDFKDFVLKHEMSGKELGVNEIKRYFNGNAYTTFYEFFKEVQRVKKLKPNTIKVVVLLSKVFTCSTLSIST